MSAKITYLSRLSKQFRHFPGRFSFTAPVSGKWAVLPQLALGILSRGNSRVGTSSTPGEFGIQSGATLVRAMTLGARRLSLKLGLLICRLGLRWDADAGLTAVGTDPLNRNELPSLFSELDVLYHQERQVRHRGVVEFAGRKEERKGGKREIRLR
jgi:hypothetical protein